MRERGGGSVASSEAFVAPAALVHSLGEPVVGKSLDGTIQTWNTGAERLYGYSAAEAIGRPISILVPEDRLDELGWVMERLAHGEEIEHLETVRRHKDGHELRVSITVTPIRSAEGEILGAAATTHDITQRTRGEEAQRFLAEAGRALAGSLDHAKTVDDAARLAVPRLADWCIVELIDAGGASRQSAVAHVDEQKEPLLQRVRLRPPFGLASSGSRNRRRLAATLIAEVEETTLEAAAGGRRGLSALRELAPRSVLVVPLLAHDRLLGTLLLARGEAALRPVRCPHR